jgi:hypothetical protein
MKEKHEESMEEMRRGQLTIQNQILAIGGQVSELLALMKARTAPNKD